MLFGKLFSRFSFMFALAFILFSSPVFAEPSIADQRREVIEKAQNDLVGIREKLAQKMSEQVKTGDKEGARNTQLRILAANDLDNMLRADSQAGGDIFKVRLIESYSGILNTPDFSEVSFREVMGSYRRIGPDQLYDATHITGARVDTGSDKKDSMTLRALQDRAIYFASQNTYEDMHAGFQRGMGQVALALNDTFADINPATSLLEAVIGTKVSGEDIGKDMTSGERAFSLGKFVVEVAVDFGTDKLMKDTTKGIKTQVGPGVGNTTKIGGAKPKLNADVDAPDISVPTPRVNGPGAGEHVIGHVNLHDVNNVDDMTPFTALDNFNIDLRTGQVTTSPKGGRIDAAGQAQIEAGFKPQNTGGNQKVNIQDTDATAFVKPPAAKEQVVGYVDLDNVNDVFDIAGFTNLENFNVDLRTGKVTTSSAPGGRIDATGQATIEAGLKPQGPLGGDQKISLEGGIHNQTTAIDTNGQTTMQGNAVWGGTFNRGFNDPKPTPDMQGVRDELKPIWDLFDLPPETSKQIPAPKQVLPILIYVEDPAEGPRVGILIDIYPGGVSPFPTFPQDPFDDCLGPNCVPPFGGTAPPFGAPPTGPDFHSSTGSPGSQFASNDDLLNDPVFFDQRFGELFNGASPSQDPHDQPN